jgi:hypothetical protein
MPRPPPTPSEDELEELPPLDGDTEDASEGDLELDELDEAKEDPLDDTTSEDAPLDPQELDLDENEASWLNEAGDSPDLELGESAPLDLRDDAAIEDADDEETGPGGEDVGLDDSPQSTNLDGGDEGPLDADEELREQDLPLLDADDEGEGDDATFWEGRLGADEPLGFPWAAKPWARVGAPLGLVQARAIACVSRGAVVAAQTETGRREIVRVDLEGAAESIAPGAFDPARVNGLSASGSETAFVLEGGKVFVGDGSETGFRAVAGGVAIAEAVVVEGGLWARTGAGALLYSGDGGRTFARCALPGSVAAIVADGTAGITALAIDDERLPIAVVRGGPGGSVAREAVEGPAPLASMSVYAARSGPLAYVARTGRLVRRQPDGAWRSFDWEGKITALSFVDDAGTLLAATYSEADEATALVRVDGSGRATIVARLGPAPDYPDSDGRAVAIACDDSRGVVWIAGGFGVAAFAVATE